MIEDKELGLKVAENENERYWEEIRQTTEKDIANLEKLLKFQRAVLEMVEGKLEHEN